MEFVGPSAFDVQEMQLQGAVSSAYMPVLAPTERQIAKLPSAPPILIVAIDTEAEFDWNGPFSRTHTNVRNLQHQNMAQQIFDRFDVRPVYLVDYAVATKPEGYVPLREIIDSQRCEIGAHLHPWITPPFNEEPSNRASFSHNLPAWLQKEKLLRLTEAISANLGVQPVSYRAGRYGIGEEISEILNSLNYSIDMSVQPGIDLRDGDGPDFRKAIDRPYWFARRGSLLEIPSTSGFTGLFAHAALPRSVSIECYKQIARPRLNEMCSLGIFARLGLLERIPLTPEGVTLSELRRITNKLLLRGQQVFVFSYHSSSLLPGSTQYVRSRSELSEFLERIAGYLQFFMVEIGGISMTPGQLLATLLKTGTASTPS